MDFAEHRPDDDTAAAGLQALARTAVESCHTALMAARQTVLSARDPAGIHAVRVALRRLRAAIALFRPVLADDVAAAVRGDAKTLADACGPTRDLDVFMAGALARVETIAAAWPDIAGELRTLRAAALRLRRARHDTVREALSGDVFAVFDVRLGGLLASGTAPWPAAPADPTMPAQATAAALPAAGAAPAPIDFAHDSLHRRDRQLRRQLKRLDALDAPERHRLRLRVKRQRYAAAFLAELFDRKDASAYIRTVTDLQDALGLANDRTVASRVVADIRVSARVGGRLDWIAGVVRGVLATQEQAPGADERAVARAARRFAKAPRFWRGRRGRDKDGERA